MLPSVIHKLLTHGESPYIALARQLRTEAVAKRQHWGDYLACSDLNLADGYYDIY